MIYTIPGWYTLLHFKIGSFSAAFRELSSFSRNFFINLLLFGFKTFIAILSFRSSFLSGTTFHRMVGSTPILGAIRRNISNAGIGTDRRL